MWPGDMKVYYDKNDYPIIPTHNIHDWPVDMNAGEVADPFELPCWTTPDSRKRLNELLGKSTVHEMVSRKAHDDYIKAKTRITRDMRIRGVPDKAMDILERHTEEARERRSNAHAAVRIQAGKELRALWEEASKCTPYVTEKDAESYFNCVMR